MTPQSPQSPMGLDGSSFADPELEAMRRKRELAMALMQQIQGGAPAPEKTRILAKTPLSSILMNLGAQHLQKGNLEKADRGMAELTRGRQEASQAEYEKGVQGLMSGADPKEAIAQALASRNPSVRAMAQARQAAMEKAEAEARKAAMERAKVISGARQAKGDTEGAIAAMQENSPDFNPARPIPAAPDPRISLVDDGQGGKMPLTVNTDPVSGKKTGTAGKLGTEITNNLPGSPGREKEMLTEANLAVLQKERLPQARAAQVALGNTARIIEELENGASTGSWQDQKQLLAKVGTLFGVDAPKLGSIDNVKKALFENVFQKAQALRPVSNEELQILKEQVGSIDTDPQALAHILSWYNAQALRTIQELDESVAPNLEGPNSALWKGLKGNVRMPAALSGPQWFQYRTLQDLQRAGGDISQFQDSIGQIPQGAQFNIRGTSQGLQKDPSTNRGAPLVSPGQPHPVKELGEKEKLAEIERLERELGLRQ